MSTAIFAGTLVALTLGCAAILLLRRFTTGTGSSVEAGSGISWKDYPISRLLDPAEFEFLRSRGVTEEQIRQVRTERRKIYRLCLRSLTSDFNRLHRTLSALLVESQHDRPDLAAAMAKLRFTFYRNRLRVELHLLLDQAGVHGLPSIDLVAPLQAIQAQIRMLSTPVAAGVAA